MKTNFPSSIKHSGRALKATVLESTKFDIKGLLQL